MNQSAFVVCGVRCTLATLQTAHFGISGDPGAFGGLWSLGRGVSDIVAFSCANSWTDAHRRKVARAINHSERFWAGARINWRRKQRDSQRKEKGAIKWRSVGVCLSAVCGWSVGQCCNRVVLRHPRGSDTTVSASDYRRDGRSAVSE